MSENNQLTIPNNTDNRKLLSLSFSIFFSIIYLMLIIVLISKIYKPDLQLILNKFYTICTTDIWSKEVTINANPEPVENMQFILSLLALPLLLASFYWIFNLIFSQFKKTLINIFFYSISIFQIGVLLFLTYIISISDGNSFATFIFDKYSFWMYILIILPSLLLVFFVYNKYSHVKKNANIISLTIIGLLIFAIFTMNLFNTNAYWGYIFHLNPIIYSSSQIFEGKTLLVDFVSQYGLYPHFINPIFSIIGFSVLKFSIVMSLLNIFTFLLMFIAMYKLIKNKFILFIGFCTLIFINYFVHRSIFYPDVYFQYFPVRVLFPALLIFISTLYLRSFNRKIYYLSFPIFAIGILWNMDTGLIVFISWVLFLSFIEFSKTLSLRIKSLNILRHLIISIITLLITITLFCFWMYLRSGHFPDFFKIIQYQQFFYSSGFNASPIPILNEWIIVVIIYIYGLAISIKSLIDKTNSTYYSSVFLLSILGFGLFSYFQSQSQPSRLSQVSYPAILLLILYTNKILSNISNNKQINLYKAFCLFIFVILFSFLGTGIFSISINGKMIKNDAIVGLKSIIDQNPNSDISKNIAFIKKHTKSGENILILADHYEGIYYAESHTICALNIPSSDELLLKEDVNKIYNLISKNKIHKTFIDINHKDDNFKNNLIYNNYGVIDQSENGQILLVNKNMGKSISDYKFNSKTYLIYNRLQIVEYNPSPKNYFELGMSYIYRESDNYEAKKAYKRATELDSDFIDAYINLTYYCCVRGEWEEAIFYSKKALELNPDDERALNNLDWAQKSLFK